tara:strand:+ start:33 stop:662 length:630 start_codon:yes stop_codon:yes gene_type:complete
MPIAINGSGTVTGISVGGLPDGIVDSDMLADNAVINQKITNTTIAEGKLAASVDYIREADHWWIHSTATMSDGDYFNANWERGDSHFDVIGTGMSQSSGVFSFPNAGKWLVLYQFTGYDVNNSHSQHVGIRTWFSTDSGSNYTQNLSIYTNAGSMNGSHWSIIAHRIIDVTNSSTFRMKINTNTQHDQQFFGNTTYPFCGLSFIRLGAT